jgi:hypothetical protein
MFTGIDFLQIFLILITAALIGSFLIFFYYPSYDLGNKFSKVINELNSLKQNKGDSNIPERILNEVMVTSTLNHLWSEYCETLHDQSNFVDGEEVTLQIRATLPSEVFFNTQTLVDTPLRTEFFKHLPGIFTGIGIIGTFNGLISGLHAFHFSDDPVALKQSLSDLLAGVSDAFIFSASAIAIAMVVILLEKVATTKRYKQIEEICQLIDSFFDAGAGEEYLASIVKSSERSATATAHLRDVAVKDLKELLTNLSEQQIKAAQDNNKFIAQSISDSIATSLKGPMETLANVAEKAIDQDGKAVESMLKNLISGFMAKLEETFGGQMSGLNTMMLETTNSMKVMQENFSQMLSLMADAGKNAGEAMGEQMKEALTIAELRQKEMNAQMEQFISALKETVSQSQSETNTQFKAMLDNINQNMTGLIENLNTQQAGVIEKATVTQKALGESTQNAVSSLHEQMNELITRNADTAAAMRENIEALQKVTINSIEKMNDGAETLYTASAEFSKAGNGMTNVLEKTTSLTNNLVTAGQNLETTSRTMQSIINEFKDTRLAISGMTESLNLIIERAKSEAGMTNEMLTKMKAITDSFNKAQIDTEDYLQKVSGVMESSFTAFSTSMATALDKSRTDFDKSLSSAVGMLRAVIEDLAENNDKA